MRKHFSTWDILVPFIMQLHHVRSESLKKSDRCSELRSRVYKWEIRRKSGANQWRLGLIGESGANQGMLRLMGESGADQGRLRLAWLFLGQGF